MSGVHLNRPPRRWAMTAVCAQRPSTAASSNRMTPPHRGRSGPDCTNSNSRRPRGSCRGSGAHSPLVRLSQQAQSAQPSAADGRSRPSKRSVRIATPRASMDRGSTSRRSLCSSASSRGEQPPLPTLAGFEFEFVAEDVASQDGSLSTLRWSIVSPRKMRGRRVGLYRGLLVVRQRLGPVVVARDRQLVSSSCLWAQHKTAGVSDDLTLRGRRVLWRSVCPFIWFHAGRLTGRGRQSLRQRCVSPLWRREGGSELCCC